MELAQLCSVTSARCDGDLLGEFERRQVRKEVALHTAHIATTQQALERSGVGTSLDDLLHALGVRILIENNLFLRTVQLVPVLASLQQ